MDAMNLTIAIPTYNRNPILLRNLELLLPQIERDAARVGLLIIDNACDEPIETTLRPLLARFPGARVEIVRNTANIGGIANVSRCFELCRTPWLWTLSDDDRPRPDALERIWKYIEKTPDCVFFNFGVDHHRPRSKTVVTRGVQEFVDSIDSLGNTVFISSGVYRADAVLPSLKFSYHYAYTMVPQFVILLQSLDDNSVCCFSHEPIVDFVRPDEDQRWARINIALGISTLLELPLKPGVRASLQRAVVGFSKEWLQPPVLIHQLLLAGKAENDARGPLFFYEQVRHRLYNLHPSPLFRGVAWGCRWLLRFPKAGLGFIEWVYRRKRGGAHVNPLQDRTKRL